MECNRRGKKPPPKNRYCEQCGRPLERPAFVQSACEAFGSVVMFFRAVILALVALYYLISLITTTDQGSSTAPSFLNALLGQAFFISDESFDWPGLTAGALLGTLGMIIWVSSLAGEKTGLRSTKREGMAELAFETH